MINLVHLRYLGTVTLVSGYFVMLSVDMTLGILMRFIGNLMVIPWAITVKAWDILFLMALFTAFEFHLLFKN